MAFNDYGHRWRTCVWGLDSGKVKISGFPFLNEFIKEAQMHHHEYKDKVFVLESKESIKKRLGKSPTSIFDSTLMGFWLVKHGKWG